MALSLFTRCDEFSDRFRSSLLMFVLLLDSWPHFISFWKFSEIFSRLLALIVLTLDFDFVQMFSQSKQQTQKLWMWRMEYLHHEQRPLYFGEWF